MKKGRNNIQVFAVVNDSILFVILREIFRLNSKNDVVLIASQLFKYKNA